MALLYQPRFRAIDDDGAPMPLAELYTRDPTATTTPKVTYSDPDLAVGHQNTNPLVADAGGWFGQMYAASDEQFYLILTAAGGDPTSPFKVYADVSALGGDSSESFARTFAAGRILITSGDVDTGLPGIITRYGSSSPDDIGGAALEEGWAGTQGDRKITNFATQEFTGDVAIAGDLDVTGLTPFMKKLVTGTAAAAASVEITLSADYDAYVVYLFDYVQSAAALLTATLSFDGTTYKTAAGDYAGSTKSIAATTVSTDASNASMALSGVTGASVPYGMATFNIRGVSTDETVIIGNVAMFQSAAASVVSWAFSTTNGKAYGKVQKIKFAPSAGNFTLKYVVFGIPG